MAMTSRKAATMASPHSFSGYSSARTVVLGLVKILFLNLSQLSFASAAPLKSVLFGTEEAPDPKDPDDPGLWIYLGTALILVLLGGAFAGLTIALMGQDGIYLQVIAASGEGQEQKHAQKVYRLLKKGKHWVLVTLLLSNVIVNETLPIVLDRSLGGGWPAVLGSTVLIVIFGEVIPQSICVRYGLQIGSFMSAPVLILMYLLAPIAWPTAKLLDRLLGEDQGTVYKKSGLKTLVTLHKTLGSSPSDRLNQDEVTIISAVLDLKDKPVGDIMTPMEDVFIMSSDTILDEKTMDIILSAGYSRIPIHEPENDRNFIGMLLVKILITYDPEDCKRVSEFALATLPETRPETSCLDIVNFFQEGKSHMVLVSEFPGEDHGATGVVTLEDVIEELIGEEIIDESDVYIDVHKAIRRMAPAPKARVQKGQIVADPDGAVIPEDHLMDLDEDGQDPKSRDRLGSVGSKGNGPNVLSSSREANLLMRRRSNTPDGGTHWPISLRGNVDDMREHLKHLGPSNLASRPKSTRYNTVKIKPGTRRSASEVLVHQPPITEERYRDDPGPQIGEIEGLLTSTRKDASDGVHAVRQAYGTTDTTLSQISDIEHKSTQWNVDGPSRSREPSPKEQSPVEQSDSEDSDTVGSLPSKNGSPTPRKRNVVRSGSITEINIDAGGVRKVILETNSSSDDPESDAKQNETPQRHSEDGREIVDAVTKAENIKKKRRRKRKGPAKDDNAATPSGNQNGY